ncbi:MAG: hypothetical protein WBA68_12520 [Alteraurantiacibacter sp.]
MTKLNPEYFTVLAQQSGFLGTFLGGVSATIFVTMMTMARS